MLPSGGLATARPWPVLEDQQRENHLMARTDRDPSGARIAITLGALVAVVMLVIWGATSLAGAFSGGLKPTPVATPIASKVPTASSGSTATGNASVRDVQTPAVPVKPAVKPDTAVATKTTPKARTNFGATGVDARRTTEAAIALSVGLKLRPLLEAQGVKVIMTRTAPKAISNKDRAAVANAANADLFLRLHCDGVDGASSIHGISMQVPSASKQWAPIGSSRKAGEIILGKLLSETGAANRGIAPRSDLVGFNWCKVTTCLPEMGFLSNRAEADKLASSSYQTKLAKALSDGTMAYLRTLR
jgi:N-acetylmuramoyl-L-alanine amidase